MDNQEFNDPNMENNEPVDNAMDDDEVDADETESVKFVKEEKKGMREVAKQVFRRQDPNAKFRFLHLCGIDPHLATVTWDPEVPGARWQEIRIFLSANNQGWARFVVTIPAILQYLHDKTNLPVARFIQVDRTNANPIRRSYLVMDATPSGKCLGAVVNTLTVEQRLDLAVTLGTLLGSLVSPEVQGDKAGVLVHRTAPAPGELNAPCELVPLPDAGNLDSLNSYRSRPNTMRTDFADCQPDAVYAWFRQCFSAQLRYHRARGNQGTVSWVRQFLVMAGELSEKGWLMGCKFTYVDQALIRPERYWVVYNEKKEGVEDNRPDTITINQITIGHEGVLAPSFVACRAPAWLWKGDMGSYTQDTTYTTNGLSESQRSVMKRFYDAAGDKYTRFSSHPIFKLASTLGWFAINGFGTHLGRREVDPQEAERMLRDWNTVKELNGSRALRDPEEYA